MYTKLMLDAYRLWDEFERDSGTAVYESTGGLSVAPLGSAASKALEASSKVYGVPFESLTAANMNQRYGTSFGPRDAALYHADTGILRATLTVATFQRMASAHGAALHDHANVVSLRDVGTRDGSAAIEAVTADGRAFRGRKVIIACGPWAEPVLRSLCGLSVRLEVVQVL
jgi:glycine/D-amino acid oxidase-like deaminating enzyme